MDFNIWMTASFTGSYTFVPPFGNEERTAETQKTQQYLKSDGVKKCCAGVTCMQPFLRTAIRLDGK